MKLFSILTILFAIVLTTFAGPTTNREEYRGDALLTKAQQAEYTERLNKGTEYFDAGKYELAEAEYKAILKFAPKKALAYFNLGLTKYKQGNFAEAIKHFDKVVKMRSYYVGAAFYYKAISQMNLDQNDEAAKTAKRYTQARFFYKPSQELIQTIKTGSDEYYENALKAAKDENYELCLLEMDESVLTDTRKGKELINKCMVSLKTAPPTEVATTAVMTKGNYYNLFFDANVSQTDNIYQENTGKIKKMTYFAKVGGQYVFRNKVDYGIGLSYEHFNAVDLPRFKNETYNVFIPFYYRADKNYYSARVFYNHDKYEGSDAYSGAGLSFNYSYIESQYLVGFYGSSSKKTSLTSAFNYKNGNYNAARLYASRFMDELTLSANVGYDQNMSGDQPWAGGNVLPYANKTISYSLTVGYDFNKVSKLSLRGNFADKDYTNIVSTTNTDRADKTTSFVLDYEHKFNANVKANLQQKLIQNASNYEAPAEFVDRDYTENITTLGISLLTY